MPRIEVMESSAGAAKATDAPAGGELVDICDDAYLPVPFSCRSATCATCHVEVVQGSDWLEPPNDAEAELLRVIRAPRGTRLACQAVVRAGGGLIRLRPVEY